MSKTEVHIDQYESYRRGWEFVLNHECSGLLSHAGPRDLDRAERFGKWFAESDWDDPQPAYAEWKATTS